MINIREAPSGDILLTGVTEATTRSNDDLMGVLETGGALRTTGATLMNETSSRSHAIFSITVEQVGPLGHDGNGDGVVGAAR